MTNENSPREFQHGDTLFVYNVNDDDNVIFVGASVFLFEGDDATWFDANEYRSSHPIRAQRMERVRKEIESTLDETP